MLVRGALRLSEGPSVGQKGPSVYQRGPWVGQISPPSVKKYFFLVRGALRCLILEGPPSVIGPSVGLSGPSVYQSDLLSVRLAFRQ